MVPTNQTLFWQTEEKRCVGKNAKRFKLRSVESEPNLAQNASESASEAACRCVYEGDANEDAI